MKNLMIILAFAAVLSGCNTCTPQTDVEETESGQMGEPDTLPAQVTEPE